MDITNITKEIDSININPETFKPHKFLMLLAVIDLFESKILYDREIFYDTALINAFSLRFSQYATIRDRNRPYAPFFHLRHQSFWSLSPNTGRENDLEAASSVGGPGQLRELVKCAVISEDLLSALTCPSTRQQLGQYLESILKMHAKHGTLSIETRENPFVAYINSLHCLDGNSDGALAERQAQEPFFCKIQVPHPLASEIYEKLISEKQGSHIILTGQAGDGKSTVGLELFKLLKGIPREQILTDGLDSKAELEYSGIKITIIKDLSEWTAAEQDDLLHSMLNHESRFFLISNTGCLLNLFKRHASKLSPPESEIEIEGKLLTAMDSGKPELLKLGGCQFEFNNLALRDNIDVSIDLWSRLIDAPDWDACGECSVSEQCPICRNVAIIKKHQNVIQERLRLLLKRMYEYGGRLTMRQISAHFSYMLCSGYDCRKIHDYANSGRHFNFGEFLFFNRFFGDSAGKTDIRAKQLRSVEVIKAQGFETLQTSGIERYLWLNDPDAVLAPQVPELEEYYHRLHKAARREIDMNNETESYLARKQIRRLFYFLYEPADKDRVRFAKFLSAFLNSPMLLEYENWQNDESLFSKRKAGLLELIFQVLQEQFSGIRIPEGTPQSNKNLYITMSRRHHDIRQSAQIVLGKIGFGGAFALKLEKNDFGTASLYLVGRGNQDFIHLCLQLPFLDYIAVRKGGGIGTVLQLSYIDRLENLKNQILKFAKLDDADGMVLLKQDAQHELIQQRLRIEQGRLEVSND